MADNSETKETLAALRAYLEGLQESGVDGLPFGEIKRADELAMVAEPNLAYAAAPATAETLDEIKAEMEQCHHCPLAATRTSLVFGIGNPQARLVLVGEAPGRDEDLQGEPFVGEAGQLLSKIILAMGLTRQDVYICNVLKCRPPGNRNPLPTEIESCIPYLLRQLDAIKPAAIMALGTFAAQTLLDTKEPISRLRGRFHDYRGTPLMPTFHPAFLLRNPAMKKEVWADMQQVMKRLGLATPQKKVD
jgi:uracil-DNA glycosylase family 4